jgi:predicted acyl esterase
MGTYAKSPCVSLAIWGSSCHCSRPEDNYPPSQTEYHTLYLDSGNGSLSYEKPKEVASVSYTSDKWEEDGVNFTHTFKRYTAILGPSKVKLFMSTQDKDDMDVYIIIRKLDIDGNLLLSLKVPLDRQPHGITFEQVDNINLYKHNCPTRCLRASKRALGQDSMLSEEQHKQQTPTELWRPYEKEEKKYRKAQSWSSAFLFGRRTSPSRLGSQCV